MNERVNGIIHPCSFGSFLLYDGMEKHKNELNLVSTLELSLFSLPCARNPSSPSSSVHEVGGPLHYMLITMPDFYLQIHLFVYVFYTPPTISPFSSPPIPFPISYHSLPTHSSSVSIQKW